MEPQKAEIIRSWELVFPNQANPHGTMFGGQMMANMDKIGGITASRYAGRSVVTASTEAFVFKRPVRVGDRIQTIAKVVWVGKSSMVVKVNVYSESPSTNEIHHCTKAHFIFVALDETGKPVEAPPLRVETDEEKRDYVIAEFVRKQALERKIRLMDDD